MGKIYLKRWARGKPARVSVIGYREARSAGRMVHDSRFTIHELRICETPNTEHPTSNAEV
jgi:hypothetical protein